MVGRDSRGGKVLGGVFFGDGLQCVFQCGGVVGFDQGFELIQYGVKVFGLGQYFMFVGEQDVVLDGRFVGGDVCEVLKVWVGQVEVVMCGGLFGDGLEVGEGQQVWQVVDGGEGSVVVVWLYFQYCGVEGGLDVGGFLYQLWVGEGLGCQDDLVIFVEVGFGMLYVV